jgi:hypothetical protein
MTGLFLDQVHFEVVDYAAAERLTLRLGQTRTAGLLGGEPYVVAAAFSADPRDVEAWVEEESLYAIRYLLDNEIYVIAAGSADWTTPFRSIPVEEVDESAQAA